MTIKEQKIEIVDLERMDSELDNMMLKYIYPKTEVEE